MKTKIRYYKPEDELAWVRCRVLSFLDSAYYDNVYRNKEHYDCPAIELVAEIDGKIVGLLDLEYEKEIGDVGYKSSVLTGVIWHLAVLPEYRNLGVATMLLEKARELAVEQNIELIQAWTRDDLWVLDWYKKRGFINKESYLHVYASDAECDLVADVKIPKMYSSNIFSHYLGDDPKMIRSKFERVHECNLFELKI